MPPCPTGTASCMKRPRSTTSLTASPNASASAHTSAVYSPRLWPASIEGIAPPCACHTRQTATPAASIAGCVIWVWLSFSSGPCSMTVPQVVTECLRGFGKGCLHLRELARERVQHADRLRTLTWKNKS